MKIAIFAAVNILIILATELSGTFFFDSGIIHIIALLFVAVAAVPLIRNYYLTDPIFKKFLTASIFAFFLFSASHVSEFLLFSLHTEYSDYIFAITINLYLASVLLMILGSEIFVRAHSGYRRSSSPMIATAGAIMMFVFFSFFLSINPESISLEPNSAIPYLYGFIVVAIAFLFWQRLAYLKTVLDASFSGFFRFLGIMIVMVIISSLLYIFYEVIEGVVRIPEYQIIYISHFLFYGGLSIMFLAFEEFLKIGGVAKDIREYMKKNKI